MSSRSNCSGCPLPLELDLNPIDSFGLLSETTPAVGALLRQSPDNLQNDRHRFMSVPLSRHHAGWAPEKAMAPMDTLKCHPVRCFRKRLQACGTRHRAGMSMKDPILDSRDGRHYRRFRCVGCAKFAHLSHHRRSSKRSSPPSRGRDGKWDQP